MALFELRFRIMSLMDLVSKEITDPRRLQGQRISLPQAFVIIVISHLCGYYSGRKIAEFGKSYEDTFTKLLKLKHGIPCHVIFTDIQNRVNDEEFISVFNKWTSTYVPTNEGDRVSGDGKVLGSTVEHVNSSFQNFKAVVSLFCQKSGLIKSIQTYEQKKANEINIVQYLIQELQNCGLVFF